MIYVMRKVMMTCIGGIHIPNVLSIFVRYANMITFILSIFPHQYHLIAFLTAG